MSPDIKNQHVLNNKNRRRSRKKRRTEDFSSDSSSESSDEAIDEAMDEAVDKPNTNDEPVIEMKQANFDLKDGYKEKSVYNNQKEMNTIEQLGNETIQTMSNIKFTKLGNAEQTGFKRSNENVEQSMKELEKDRSELDNEFLKLMMSSFTEDLDELRKKPDFTDRSLILLAKALQSGKNMFDENSLRSILE